MESSNNFFELIDWFQKNVDWLNAILIGDESTAALIDGVEKPSISKSIFDQFESIKTMVNGRVSFASKAQMESDLNHPENTLAEVWNDAQKSNNGLYGKEGLAGEGAWVKSPYDNVNHLESVVDNYQKSLIELIDSATALVDQQGNEYAFCISDENGATALSIDQYGRLKVTSYPDLEAAKTEIEQSKEDISYLRDGNLEYQKDKVLDNSGKEVAFAITDESGAAALIIYKNGDVKTGSSDLIQDISNLTNLILTKNDEYPGDKVLTVEDEFGAVALSLNDRGDLTVGTMETETAESPYVYSIQDERGQVAFGINEKGEVIFQQPPSRQSGRETEFIPADFNQIVQYGQSLSVGQVPALTVSQPHDNVMFAGGVRVTTEEESDLTSFLPMVEQDRETPTSSALNYLVNLRKSEDGLEYQEVYLGSAPGEGGKQISELWEGTEYWERVKDHITHAHNNALSSNRTHNVKALLWTQGENDMSSTSRKAYREREVKLYEQFDSLCRSLTGQSFSPIMITYQVASHLVTNRGGYPSEPNIALAQLDVSNTEPNVYMAMPMYQFDYHSDDIHTTSASTQWFGHYYGLVLKKVLHDNVDWKPLQPKSVTWSGSVIDIWFHVPHGKLTFDTDWVSEAPNYGFDVWSDSDELKDVIESVEIVSKDRVRIVLTSANDVSRLTYARGRQGDEGANRLTGARGNLRDTQGEVYNFSDNGGVTRHLHNWCVIFDNLRN
ncbi:TPA: sialate O-acetylesterase [Vibrio campbellii]